MLLSSEAEEASTEAPSPMRNECSVGGSFAAGLGGNLRFGRLVSEGSCGGFFTCVHQGLDMATGRFVNIKSVTLDVEGEGEDEGRRQQHVQERLSAEIRLLEAIRHENLVAVLGHDLEGNQLHIHVERFGVGSVASFLADFGPLAGSTLQKVLHGCLGGLEYLHTREPAMAHGDVRGATILMGHGCNVKLADFGCGQLFGPRRELYITAGTLPWKAPEVVQQDAPDLLKADLWSLGCTFVEMSTAGSPWGSEVALNTLLSLLRDHTNATPPIPEHLPENGKDMARRCLQRDPTARATAAELLRHAFVAGYSGGVGEDVGAFPPAGGADRRTS